MARLLSAEPRVVSVPAAVPEVVQIPLLPLACAVVKPKRAPSCRVNSSFTITMSNRSRAASSSRAIASASGSIAFER